MAPLIDYSRSNENFVVDLSTNTALTAKSHNRFKPDELFTDLYPDKRGLTNRQIMGRAAGAVARGQNYSMLSGEGLGKIADCKWLKEAILRAFD